MSGDKKLQGDYAVAICVSYFLSRGYQVLRPIGDRGHYDLVVEKDGVFQRVQSKSTTVIYPKTHITLAHYYNNGTHKYTYKPNDFDLLWIGTPNAFYLIPWKDALQGQDTKLNIYFSPTCRWNKYMVIDEQLPIAFPNFENLKKQEIEDDKRTKCIQSMD